MTKEQLAHFEAQAKKLYEYAEVYDLSIARAFKEFWAELSMELINKFDLEALTPIELQRFLDVEKTAREYVALELADDPTVRNGALKPLCDALGLPDQPTGDEYGC